MKANRMGVVLRGDRNQCSGCDRLFRSSYAFDKHRTGEHGKDRRCRTEDEMRERGMVLGSDGFWRGSAMPDRAVAAVVGEVASHGCLAQPLPSSQERETAGGSVGW